MNDTVEEDGFTPSQLGYLKNLVRFAFSNNRLLFLNVPLIIASAGIEILAMSILLPLSTVAMNSKTPVEGFWADIFSAMNWDLTPRSLLLLFVSLFAIRVLTQLAVQGLGFYLGAKIQAELSSRAFESVITRFSLREVENKTIGYFISIAGDEASRAGTIVTLLNQFFALFVLAALYFVAIFLYSNLLALAVCGFLLATFVSLFGAFKKSHQLGERQIEQRRWAYSIFLDSLNGLRTIKAFNATEYVANDYERLILRYAQTAFAIDFLNLLARLLPILILLGVAAIIVSLNMLTLGDAAQFAFVVTMLIYLMRFFPATGQCLNVLLRVVADTKAGKDVTSILRADEQSTPCQSGLPIGRPVHRVECKNLSFSYGRGKPVLEAVDVLFESGKSYGVVGPSGSGKSTLTDLLVGFYEADQGTIVFDGVPVDRVGRTSLRESILLLGQKSTVFNASVTNNVALGLKDVGVADVKRACELACIDEFVVSLPNGYDTVLNYQGSNFSGGQLQRIGIARALIRRPDVLILDESTSAVDSTTRDRLIENICAEYADRIVIFVTHDHSILSRLDHVHDMEIINRVAGRHQSESDGRVKNVVNGDTSSGGGSRSGKRAFETRG